MITGNLDKFHLSPCFNAMAATPLSALGVDVDEVIVSAKMGIKQPKFLTFDEAAMIKEANYFVPRRLILVIDCCRFLCFRRERWR